MSICIVVWCFLGIFILGIVVTTAVCCWIIGSIQWWTICSITFLLSVAVIACPLYHILGGNIKNSQVSARNIFGANYYLYLCISKVGKMWIISIILPNNMNSSRSRWKRSLAEKLNLVDSPIIWSRGRVNLLHYMVVAVLARPSLSEVFLRIILTSMQQVSSMAHEKQRWKPSIMH